MTELLENAEGYSDEIRKRVETIIFAQMRKYPYLFFEDVEKYNGERTVEISNC